MFCDQNPLMFPSIGGSHGPFSWGKDSHQAVFNAVVLEELARMALFTIQINPEIQSIPQSLLEKRYEKAWERCDLWTNYVNIYLF